MAGMDEKTIEALGMRLANRAYLYGLFRVGFGAMPSVEVLAQLTSQQARDALSYLGGACGQDAACGTAALATAVGTAGVSVADPVGGERESAVADMLGASKALAEASAFLADAADKCGDAAFVDATKTEFERLYMVPGKAYVYPWESPYAGQITTIFKESTLDVRRRYEEYGFSAEERGHFPEDNIAMMCGFMAHLSRGAYESFADGDDANVHTILESQAPFADAHLGEWVSQFAEKTRKNDRTGLYAHLASALEAFLRLDRAFVAQALASGLV